MQMTTLQQFVHCSRFRAPVAAVAAVAACLAMTGCGGGGSSGPPKRPPSAGDVAAVAGAMSDIVFQCQSVQAGLTASVDASAIGRDVDVLLHVYRRVRPDAKLTIGPLHTTPRHELELARANLQGGCSPAAARRLANALRG
jgi:hypothetical protein